MSKRKKYDPAFKRDAVSLVLEQNYSQADAARNLGINAQILGRWVREFENKDSGAFRGNGKLSPEQQEIRDLKFKVKRLEMEKEILKKASQFFAKEMK